MTTVGDSAIPLPPHLQNLNPQQRTAVETLDGPLLVLAGAGTGKTRVLTSRLVHILATRRAWPSQILAVTFTNKAAQQMRDRVSSMVGHDIHGEAPQAQMNLGGWWLGTFHALAARMLRRHAEHVGLKPNFTILDADDQVRLVKQLLQAEHIDDRKWPARVISAMIERWKDRGLTPDKLAADAGGEAAGGKAVAIYRQYQERLTTLNATDFGDLLLHNLTIFQTRPDVLAEYHERFRYILVDEYQDTNVAQYLWLRLLAQKRRNLCCVGDDDQSIYGWRGAEVGNILRFEKDFPGAQVIRLEENYRSTRHILGAAAGLIAHNQGRLGKTLWTAADGGEKVQVRALWDGEAEARWVGEEIETLQRNGQSLGQVAVLVRAGFQTREFEERFLTLGVAYRVVGGPRFYEREEIRDATAYLRVTAQPDDDLAFERIINKPRRGIGDATVQTLHRLARAESISLTAAARRVIESDELKPQARSALRRLLDDFARWSSGLAGERSDDEQGAADLAATILDESGYTAMWQAERTADAPGRLENLKELIAAIEEFGTLTAFLEHVSLVMENAEGSPGDMVSLMTLHSAKGLEFETVFLPGWEEGLLPHPRALEEKGEAGLEEERRLAHVGLTRARRRAFVSFAANRRIHNLWQSSVPSRFVSELPPEHVEIQSEQGLWGGGFAESERYAESAGGFAEAGAGAFRQSGRVINARGLSFSNAPRPSPSVPFSEGARVFHQKFGYGRVIAAEAGKLDIEFDKAGRKKVMDSFVQPA